MRCASLLLLLACLVAPARAFAIPGVDLATPGALCRQAVAWAERGEAIPAGLLGAIGRVESGRRDAASGDVTPWPWTIDVEGQGHFYQSKAEAVAAVRQFQAQGARSIDVGCMQVNLLHHPDAFPSLEAAFDPDTNASYAARFLRQLYGQTGDWGRAAAMYHSATPELGAEYKSKVMAAWPEETRLAAAQVTSPLARSWAATLGSGPFGPSRGFVAFAIRRRLGAATLPIALPGMVPSAGRSLAAYRAVPIAIASRAPTGAAVFR